jgi:hypothetical protein
VAVTGATDERGDFGAIEIDRVVPSCGILKVRPQQVWIGPAHAGTIATLRIDTTTVYVSMAGRRIKTLPSRFTTTDLARLRAEGARPAGPPPAARSGWGVARDVIVEVDRTVNASGTVGLGRTTLGIGAHYAGQRVTLRVEAEVIHVVVGGVLARTLPCPFSPQQRARLAGARVAGPPPELPPATTRVQRRVSVRGNMQVVGQRVQVGIRHAHTIVDVDVEDRSIRVLSEAGEVLTIVARTTTKELTRFKAYGSKKAGSG